VLESEGGGGRAEHLLRGEGGGSNDGKRSAKYARGLRESGSMGEAGVMLVGFRIRNEFRERLVTWLKKRGYHVKKAGWWVYQGERPRGEMSQPQDIRKRAAWERCIGSEGMKTLGARGRGSGGWLC